MVYVSPPAYEIPSVEYARGVKSFAYSTGEERVSSSPRAGQRRLRETNPLTSRDRAVHKEYELREALEKKCLKALEVLRPLEKRSDYTKIFLEVEQGIPEMVAIQGVELTPLELLACHAGVLGYALFLEQEYAMALEIFEFLDDKRVEIGRAEMQEMGHIFPDLIAEIRSHLCQSIDVGEPTELIEFLGEKQREALAILQPPYKNPEEMEELWEAYEKGSHVYGNQLARLVHNCCTLGSALVLEKRYVEALGIIQALYDNRDEIGKCFAPDKEIEFRKGASTMLAVIHFQLGNIQESVRYMILQSDPKFGAFGWLEYGIAELIAGDIANAARIFREECGYFDRSIAALLLQLMGKSEDVVFLVEKEGCSDATALALKGDYAASLQRYTSMIEGREEASDYIERALVYLLMGNKEAARNDLLKAQTIKEEGSDLDINAKATFVLEWIRTTL